MQPGLHSASFSSSVVGVTERWKKNCVGHPCKSCLAVATALSDCTGAAYLLYERVLLYCTYKTMCIRSQPQRCSPATSPKRHRCLSVFRRPRRQRRSPSSRHRPRTISTRPCQMRPSPRVSFSPASMLASKSPSPLPPLHSMSPLSCPRPRTPLPPLRASP